MEEKYENGFYWVTVDGTDWTIAYHHSKNDLWVLFSSGHFKTDQLKEIGEAIPNNDQLFEAKAVFVQ